MKTLTLLLCLLSGCTTYHAKVGESEVWMCYFLQDKQIESVTFNPDTKAFEIVGVKSEMAQVVTAAGNVAIKAAGGLR